MGTHSRLAPSAAERWIHCPASVHLNEQFPDTTSIYAQEGTVAHKLGELKIRKQILNDQEVTDKDFDAVYSSEFYNADMEDYTDEYVIYISSLIHKYGITSVLTESHLDLSFIAPDTWGKADCVLVYGNTLHVVDFKYGKNVEVKPYENPQLKLYALGACKLLDGLIYDIQKVTVHIVQPRMNNCQHANYSKDDLYKWADETVKPQAEKALNESSESNAGDWCKFCKAKSICREYGKRYDLDFDPVDPNQLSNTEIAERIRKLDGLTAYLKDLKNYALTHLLNGENFPGFKVVAGRSNRTWKDQEKAFEVAQANGYDHSVLFTQTPLTLSQVEEVMGKKQFKALLSDYVEKPPGKPTLVPEDDSRESIGAYNSALEDFKDIKFNK